MENKYKDIEMYDITKPDDVLDLFGDSFLNYEIKDDEYIAVYGQRNLISHIFMELLNEGYELGYADLDMMDDHLEKSPYMLFVRGNCVISVEPALSNKGEVIKHDAKICYIDMDNIKQNIIDYCVNSDKKVVLFGYPDDECDDNIENYNLSNNKLVKDEKSGLTTFSKTDAIKNGYYSVMFSSTNTDLVREFAKLYK